MLQIVKIFSCGTYHPWRYRGEVNPNARNDTNSKAMMDFKNESSRGHESAVRRFANILIEALPTYLVRNERFVSLPFDIAIVPSHTAGRVSPALIRVAEAIVRRYPSGRVNLCLERHVSVPSAHRDSGDRSVVGHMNTIRVNGEVNGRYVLLLDDVKTTGGSMSACYYLLESAGAGVIFPLALLETANYEE
ncbi:phosphoribosyltransferase [Hafnia paralvei]|jgi:predicted amidophosphoribosyltransferase|uniref:phosphoribosyltransferase n=1 Tax=Hafnia paralvei TaxID=546367 RepID=UPI00057E5452|nr:phosphoribosyltransferase [Hafnia paralvei]KHS50044.1 hypothetical protein RN38_03520 [Hafnia paralvei]